VENTLSSKEAADIACPAGKNITESIKEKTGAYISKINYSVI